MDANSIPKNKRMKPLAAQLRNGATREENHLWYDFLRTYPVQFNRQRIIGNFVVDFFCRRASLVIELDGTQHYSADALEYDAERTAFLNGLGIQVLRFSNREIWNCFEGVCTAIDVEVQKRLLGEGAVSTAGTD